VLSSTSDGKLENQRVYRQQQYDSIEQKKQETTEEAAKNIQV
jgi:hypothetical protein